MGAFSSKGTSIWLTKGSATPVNLTPTTISMAKPAQVTVNATTGISDGDVAFVKTVGFSELDGKVFKVANVAATTFDLQGSDTTGSTGVLAGTPEIVVYKAADMLKLCLASLSINNEEPGTTGVGTFCDPSASLPSAVQAAGTINVTGWVNDSDSDYIEMIAACADAKERVLEIRFPNHGSLIAPVTFGAMGYDIPIEGAPGWSATGVLGSRFQHVF